MSSTESAFAMALETLRLAVMDVGPLNSPELDGALGQISALPHQVRAALALNGGNCDRSIPGGVPVVEHSNGGGVSRALHLNRHRKSLVFDFLVLSALERGKRDLVVVDQILAHLAKVFPQVKENGRPSLITRISRLKRDKGCIVEDDDLKGVGYKISEGGLKYLRDLETTYLTKDEKAFIKARLA